MKKRLIKCCCCKCHTRSKAKNICTSPLSHQRHRCNIVHNNVILLKGGPSSSEFTVYWFSAGIICCWIIDTFYLCIWCKRWERKAWENNLFSILDNPKNELDHFQGRVVTLRKFNDNLFLWRQAKGSASVNVTVCRLQIFKICLNKTCFFLLEMNQWNRTDRKSVV